MRSNFSPIHAAPEHVKEAGCVQGLALSSAAEGLLMSVHLQVSLKSDPSPPPPEHLIGKVWVGVCPPPGLSEVRPPPPRHSI